MKQLVFISIFLFALGSNSWGQQNDFVGLTAWRVVKPLNPYWSVQLAGQTMFNENLHELWVGFGELSIHRKLNEHWSTGLHYRAISYHDVHNVFQPRHALFHTLSYTHIHRSWIFNIRSRNQITRYGNLGESPVSDARYYSRNKFTLKRRWNYHWSNAMAAEFFLPLNGLRQGTIDQMRYTFGAEYRVNRRHEFGAYYQWQQLRNRSRNNNYFVLGIQYTFSLL